MSDSDKAHQASSQLVQGIRFIVRAIDGLEFEGTDLAQTQIEAIIVKVKEAVNEKASDIRATIRDDVTTYLIEQQEFIELAREETDNIKSLLATTENKMFILQEEKQQSNQQALESRRVKELNVQLAEL